MKAGTLSERVAILRKTTAQDSVGQPITTWATLTTVWAEASEMRAREFIEAAGRQVEVTTRFRMRYTDLAYEDHPRGGPDRPAARSAGAQAAADLRTMTLLPAWADTHGTGPVSRLPDNDPHEPARF